MSVLLIVSQRYVKVLRLPNFFLEGVPSFVKVFYNIFGVTQLFIVTSVPRVPKHQESNLGVQFNLRVFFTCGFKLTLSVLEIELFFHFLSHHPRCGDGGFHYRVDEGFDVMFHGAKIQRVFGLHKFLENFFIHVVNLTVSQPWKEQGEFPWSPTHLLQLSSY